MKNGDHMKLKMNYLVLAILMLSIGKVQANCPEFATALEQAMVRATSKEVGSVAKTKAPIANWNSKEANSYKALHGRENRGAADNRAFMNQMAKDKAGKKSNIIYFDVENAVQKKLNDSLVGDKGMVDAINNSFMTKFNSHLKADKELMSRIQGQYQDFKSLRLRLELRPGDNAADFEKRFSDLYAKSNKEFAEEFQKGGLTKLIPPRTDEVVDVSTWFLSGTGESALEANMAARGARTAGFSNGKATSISFKNQVAKMHDDVKSIEGIRRGLAAQDDLLKSKMMIKTETGEIIPSKDMIGVLRKIKLSDCEDVAEYNAKIRAKVRKLFGKDISDKNIADLTTYFSKVDSISPPLFQRERVAIDLAEAKSGIVSVDFAGVGVDNAYEQMKALSAVNYVQKDKSKMLKDAFTKIQNNVDDVTEDMNKAKRTFTNSANDPTPTKYSGDDGILMPDKSWGMAKKQELIKTLAANGDPGKYRVTFVRTEYTSGATIPAMERSQYVVRAEGVEKSIREAIVGAAKIPSERARKMIIAIDSRPSVNGVKYDLIIGGEKPTAEELKMIKEAFNNSMNKEKGETSNAIVEAFN
jgi:hypothetical protein